MNPDSLATLLGSEAAGFEAAFTRLLGTVQLAQLALLLRQQLSGMPTAQAGIAKAAWNLLDIRLSDVLVKVWNEAGVFRKYLNPREYDPSKEVFVALTEHEFQSEHQPRLEIVVDGRAEFVIVLNVKLALSVSGVVLKIQDAKIKELNAGWCKGKAGVSCGGLQLIEQETGKIEFRGSIDFGAGIPIAP